MKENEGEMKPTATNLLKSQPALPNLLLTHQKLNLIAELTVTTIKEGS